MWKEADEDRDARRRPRHNGKDSIPFFSDAPVAPEIT
jgi:hypothetical protein